MDTEIGIPKLVTVPETMETQKQLLVDMSTLIKQIESRLDMVLITEPEKSEASMPQPTPISMDSGLVDSIREHSGMIRHASNKMESILRRLTL